jgi:hypothetical protein
MQWLLLLGELISLIIFLRYIFKLVKTLGKINDLYTLVSFVSIILTLTSKIILRTYSIIAMEVSQFKNI